MSHFKRDLRPKRNLVNLQFMYQIKKLSNSAVKNESLLGSLTMTNRQGFVLQNNVVINYLYVHVFYNFGYYRIIISFRIQITKRLMFYLS